MESDSGSASRLKDGALTLIAICDPVDFHGVLVSISCQLLAVSS